MSSGAWGRFLFGGRDGRPGPPPDASTKNAFLAPLIENREGVGDFTHAGIQKLGNPVPITIHNSGTELLELWLEPFGQDYYLKPGDVFVVTSYGTWGGGKPFEVLHEPGRIEVWATSWFATVSFEDGTEVPGGYQGD